MKKTFGVVLSCLPGIVVAWLASLFLHPSIYERASSSEFAKLRGGPAIGMGLILLNCVVKRAVVRQYIEQEEATRSSLLDLLALLWGALEVALGTFLADLWRATQQKDE